MVETELIEVLTLLAKIFFIVLFLTIAVYVYSSIAIMRIAKKIGVGKRWLAWIPIANFYLYSRMAKMHWWPIFILVGVLIPYLGIISTLAFTVFLIVWFWKIFEYTGNPGWWSIFLIIPIFGLIIFLIFLGIAAWSNKKTVGENKIIPPQTQRQIQKPSPEKKIISPRTERINKLKGSLK